MRISEEEKTAILEMAKLHFGEKSQVRLFGSRADDSLRGGDLDLLVETSLSSEEAHSRRVPFLVDLKRRIGERRIDLVVSSSDSSDRPIDRLARREGILLK